VLSSLVSCARNDTIRRRARELRSYSFLRYASKAARSSSFTNPRSMSRAFDERSGGKAGGGFGRAHTLEGVGK